VVSRINNVLSSKISPYFTQPEHRRKLPARWQVKSLLFYSELTKLIKKTSTDIKGKNLINKLTSVHSFRCARKIAKSDFWSRHVFQSLRPSVRMEQLGSHCRDFHEIYSHVFFENLSRNIKFH